MSNPKYANQGDPLGKFIEECGEALAAAGKIARFGYKSRNPELGADAETNEDWLIREIFDLEEAITRLRREREWEVKP